MNNIIIVDWTTSMIHFFLLLGEGETGLLGFRNVHCRLF